jgi:uncharacterized membrane protein
MMQGKATIRRHPIHLMLISFPIGLWTGAFATDVAGELIRDPFWFHMSVVLLGMGNATGLAASAFGLVDYLTVPMEAPARRLATAHLVWSTVALVAFLAAFAVRIGNHGSPLGIGLTAAGTIAFGAGGYLGSALVIGHRVGLPE